MASEIQHFTIPVFIPMQGCPHACVFCDQRKITSGNEAPDDIGIIKRIEKHLETIPRHNSKIEIGFFGGSFTGLTIERQKHYLNLVQPWLKSGIISGMRLSTRPDYINDNILQILKDFGVNTIELGAQSLDNEVLQLAGRRHTSEQVRQAAALIKRSGFSLGLQMMLGLPGDTFQKSINTAKGIISSGADCTRIYPTLVVQNTDLEIIYKKGEYQPLTLDEAVEWCSSIVLLFEEAKVKILRIGLHPGEGMIHGNDIIAGPFHVAFGELVHTALWKDVLLKIPEDPSAAITVFVNPGQLNSAIGHKGSNKKLLQQRFRDVKFKVDKNLFGREFYVDHR